MTAPSETQQPTGDDTTPSKDVEQVREESWNEHAAFSTEYTPYSTQRIPLLFVQNNNNNNCYIDIQSIDTSNMTLLDVCNYGEHDQVDGSGHCVWNGALFFLRAMALQRSNYWPFGIGQVHCEMGCGTGTAGIGLLKLLLQQQLLLENSNRITNNPTAKVLFLDNDPQALELCRQNCHNNHLSKDSYEVLCQESWVDIANNNDNQTTTALEHSSQQTQSSIDTIFATDVLYDLKIIRPFFITANKTFESSCSSSVTRKKYLVLSHVPRWFLPSDKSASEVDLEDPARQLEQYIVQQAQDCGFSLVQTTRPKDLLQQQSNGNEVLMQELQEMDQAGAVLWVFEKMFVGGDGAAKEGS